MWQSVLIQRALPLSISYLLLIVASLSLDYLLHVAGLSWVGRYLGPLGTAFIIFSFGYSARKHKVVRNGTLKAFLRMHCNAGWVGTLMILVHSGVHFNALLPWAATGLMMVVTASGHVGQYLLRKFREEVTRKKKELGMTDSREPEEYLTDIQQIVDSLTVRALEQWRAIHMPLVSFLVVLTLFHMLSVAFFLNWR
ncbi:MAG: hypothetical protein HGB02_08125 [Chlorobiaceae bacterium]|nr:hypothetical protein [Chlorobiaceae bacterium]